MSKAIVRESDEQEDRPEKPHALPVGFKNSMSRTGIANSTGSVSDGAESAAEAKKGVLESVVHPTGDRGFESFSESAANSVEVQTSAGEESRGQAPFAKSPMRT